MKLLESHHVRKSEKPEDNREDSGAGGWIDATQEGDQ